jgi:hypothetical protein
MLGTSIKMTSYLLGKIKRAIFTTLDVMAPGWWNCERCKRILKDVGPGRYDKLIIGELTEEQPTEICYYLQ